MLKTFEFTPLGEQTENVIKNVSPHRVLHVFVDHDTQSMVKQGHPLRHSR